MAEDNKQITVEDVLSTESSIQKDIEGDLLVNAQKRGILEMQLRRGALMNLGELTGRAEGIQKVDKALTSDLEELRRLRDEGQLDRDLLQARKKGDDEAILKASQEVLRLKEFEQTVGDQLEAEQLAQRTLFRESQSLARQQAQFESGAQQAAASLQNRAAQTGISNSSAIQGMVASINTQRGVGVSDFQTQLGDISSDRQRLATNLTNDLDFLNETFDLGGDISAATQSIANRQAKEAQAAQDRSERNAIVGSVASLGGFAIGGPVGAAKGKAFADVLTSLF
jgi:post-segregation antitoxin (ccd killing protein)